MNSSDNTTLPTETARQSERLDAVLVREAGVHFAPAERGAPEADPFAQWLGLMEVVEMLCPVWPVRDSPMQGTHWRL